LKINKLQELFRNDTLEKERQRKKEIRVRSILKSIHDARKEGKNGSVTGDTGNNPEEDGRDNYPIM